MLALLIIIRSFPLTTEDEKLSEGNIKRKIWNSLKYTLQMTRVQVSHLSRFYIIPCRAWFFPLPRWKLNWNFLLIGSLKRKSTWFCFLRSLKLNFMILYKDYTTEIVKFCLLSWMNSKRACNRAEISFTLPK